MSMSRKLCSTATFGLKGFILIPNHKSARLSALDLRMVEAVPPGGNWRDIPLSIPSARLEQIRRSCAEGKGSRSTYYGRLHPARPAYTIGTYFSRPGNGCFVHHDYQGGQHRVISQREAARLQSFPDTFEFHGPQRAVNQQIGNAVPPLLAWEIATTLGEPGDYVDVFCGAGGLSLGFHWAGWNGLCATDIEAHALRTYSANLAHPTLLGNLAEAHIVDSLIDFAGVRRRRERPLTLVGGPPCQGFSTAGNRRSVEDERNLLYRAYAEVLDRFAPDYFVFENVAGILSLDGGRVIETILGHLGRRAYELQVWRLNAADFGVPQRRNRVLLVGSSRSMPAPKAPMAWTADERHAQFPSGAVCSVSDALDDLPALLAGQDGSSLDYCVPPSTEFQRLARGMLTPAQYKTRCMDRDSDNQPRPLCP